MTFGGKLHKMLKLTQIKEVSESYWVMYVGNNFLSSRVRDKIWPLIDGINRWHL